MNAVKIKLTMYMYHDMLFINKFVCPIYSTSETRELCDTVSIKQKNKWENQWHEKQEAQWAEPVSLTFHSAFEET
jgi:hypothetical protein